MPHLSQLQVEVERRMRRGERFSDVEALIDETDLSDDEKAALWLLGWSYLDRRAQRREAHAHIDRLVGAERRPLPSMGWPSEVIDGGAPVIREAT